MPGTITLFATSYEPRGYAKCNGQLLPIDQNQALYQVLGTRFGGDGTATFALPDLPAIAGVEKPEPPEAPTVRYIASGSGQITLFAGTYVPRGYTRKRHSRYGIGQPS